MPVQNATGMAPKMRAGWPGRVAGVEGTPKPRQSADNLRNPGFRSTSTPATHLAFGTVSVTH